MDNTQKFRQDIRAIVSRGALSGGKKKSKAMPKKIPVGYMCKVSVVNGVTKSTCSTIYNNKQAKKELGDIHKKLKNLMKELNSL